MSNILAEHSYTHGLRLGIDCVSNLTSSRLVRVFLCRLLSFLLAVWTRFGNSSFSLIPRASSLGWHGKKKRFHDTDNPFNSACNTGIQGSLIFPYLPVTSITNHHSTDDKGDFYSTWVSTTKLTKATFCYFRPEEFFWILAVQILSSFPWLFCFGISNKRRSIWTLLRIDLFSDLQPSQISLVRQFILSSCHDDELSLFVMSILDLDSQLIVF